MITDVELEILALSLKVSAVAVLFTLPFSVLVAWLLSRGRFRGKSIVDAVVTAPLVLPPVVTGYGLLVVFGRRGVVGEFLHDLFGVSFAFNWWGGALAAGVVSFPLAVRAVRLSFDAIEPRLEQAALTLGAGPRQVFFRVTLPLAIPGIVTGAVLSFARSIGEFGATITFVGNVAGETRTLPLAIYSALQEPGAEGRVVRLVVLSLVLATGALIASEALARRKRS